MQILQWTPHGSHLILTETAATGVWTHKILKGVIMHNFTLRVTALTPDSSPTVTKHYFKLI